MHAKPDISFSVIIPVFNEEHCVIPLFSELFSVMEGIREPYEIIFVNDGSSDGTGAALDHLLQQYKPLRVINHPSNLGQPAAFGTGVKEARGEIILTLDGDGQNDPGDIPALLQKMAEGYDVVCGWRKKRQDRLRIRFISRIANFFRRIMLGEKIHDTNCSFRAYKNHCLKDLDIRGEMYYMLTAILSGRGCKIAEIETRHRQRKFESTKFSMVKRLSWIRLIYVYFITRKKFTAAKQ